MMFRAVVSFLVLMLSLPVYAQQATEPQNVAAPEPAAEEKKSAVRELTLDPIYLRPDGAIMTLTSGELVDPYFPTKALLIAHDSGMDVSKLATQWINWMIARQEPSGLFSRYCFKQGETTYTSCAVADADDSMMAMWVELLYRMSPRGGMPAAWRESADKAEYILNTLYNPQATVFMISKANQVGLLMDNLEIYSAFKRIEREAVRQSEGKKSIEYRGKAAQLAIGILGQFWDPAKKRFIASTQKRTVDEFYPDKVVQMMPLMSGFELPKPLSESRFYSDWMKQHRKEWFSLIGKEYPWGLLAVLAVERKDYAVAGCWLKQSEPSRHSKTWNVMDEAAFQIVSWKLENKKFDKKKCAGGKV